MKTMNLQVLKGGFISFQASLKLIYLRVKSARAFYISCSFTKDKLLNILIFDDAYSHKHQPFKNVCSPVNLALEFSKCVLPCMVNLKPAH